MYTFLLNLIHNVIQIYAVGTEWLSYFDGSVKKYESISEVAKKLFENTYNLRIIEIK